MSNSSAAKIRVTDIRVVGDTFKPFWIQLVDETGAVLDLGGCSATFKMILESDQSEKIASSACTISNNVISYAPQPADVDTAGTYMGMFTTTFVSGAVSRAILEYEIAANI